jgi:hypothetical protein
VVLLPSSHQPFHFNPPSPMPHHNLQPPYIQNSSMEELPHSTTLDQKPIMKYMCCGYETLQNVYASQAFPRPLIAPFIQMLLQVGNSLQKHNKSCNVITHLHMSHKLFFHIFKANGVVRQYIHFTQLLSHREIDLTTQPRY